MRGIDDKKIVRMQYPYDCTGNNRMFDGQMHEIIPQSITPIRLCGMQFLVLYYYDVTIDTAAVTLLIRIGDTFAKVPLDDYNVLFDYLNTQRIDSVDLSNDSCFPPEIPLAQSLCASAIFGLNPDNSSAATNSVLPPEDTLNPYYDEKPFIPLEEYIPVFYDEDNLLRGGIFYSNGVVIDSFSNYENYSFDRGINFPEKDVEIRNGMLLMQENHSDRFRHVFRISVPEGATANIMSLSKDGTVQMQTVLLLPGIHEYTINYAACTSKNDFINSRRAEKIIIGADWPKYRDVHDTDRAFYGGCREMLPMHFYSFDGYDINNGYFLGSSKKK